jgi:hypothetical protein
MMTSESRGQCACKHTRHQSPGSSAGPAAMRVLLQRNTAHARCPSESWYSPLAVPSRLVPCPTGAKPSESGPAAAVLVVPCRPWRGDHPGPAAGIWRQCCSQLDSVTCARPGHWAARNPCNLKARVRTELRDSIVILSSVRVEVKPRAPPTLAMAARAALLPKALGRGRWPVRVTRLEFLVGEAAEVPGEPGGQDAGGQCEPGRVRHRDGRPGDVREAARAHGIPGFEWEECVCGVSGRQIKTRRERTHGCGLKEWPNLRASGAGWPTCGPRVRNGLHSRGTAAGSTGRTQPMPACRLRVARHLKRFASD